MWPRLTRNPIQFYDNIFKFVNCNSDVYLHSINSCDIAHGKMSGKHLSQYKQTFKWKKTSFGFFSLGFYRFELNLFVKICLSTIIS